MKPLTKFQRETLSRTFEATPHFFVGGPVTNALGTLKQLGLVERVKLGAFNGAWWRRTPAGTAAARGHRRTRGDAVSRQRNPDGTTPRPWNVMNNGRSKLVHIETDAENAAGAGIAIVSVPKAFEADAELIVRAVNAYDDLLAAAVALEGEGLECLGRPERCDDEKDRCGACMLRDALTKARNQ